MAKRVVASPAPVLAPLTRAGTAPFRALCRRHGAEATMGEMIFARQLCKGDRREQARLRRPEAETLFGAQIATNQISEGVAACVLAEEAGAAWVDLNCGCPIYEATRRGLGSALLRKPAKLARLVGGLVEGSPLPVSVKIRLSPAGNKDVNALEHIEALAALDHKPAFVTLHARTATQRYGRAATWEDVEACARKAGELGAFPVLGNGDVLTHFEARRKRAVAPTAAGLMVGRGALINPWLFDDIKNQNSWLPTAEERLEVYYSLVAGYRDTFGDDERGRKTAWYFVPFHFNFFHRWRPLSEEHFGAFDVPLIQNGRAVDAALEEIEGPRAHLAPLEQLLRCAHADAGEAIADALWSSRSVADAVAAAEALATPENLAAWEQPDAEARDEDEGHSSSPGKTRGGGGRRNS